MKTRAAIAYAAGKPLEVVTVDLDGSEGRRSAGGDQGERGVPHG